MPKKQIGCQYVYISNASTSQVPHSFLYIFLCRRCTTTTWKLLISLFWRTWTQENDFLFLFVNFRYNTVFKNSPPEKIANIWWIERDGISATNWLKSRWAGFINRGEYKISHNTSVPFWICPEAGFSSNFPALDTRKIRRRTLFSVTLSRKKPCPVGPSLCTADPSSLKKPVSPNVFFFFRGRGVCTQPSRPKKNSSVSRLGLFIIEDPQQSFKISCLQFVRISSF